MPRSGEPTRQKILDAAEEVIAERGVDAATFAQINSRAGQRNNSATQYHFGDRVSLLEAVVDRHVTRIAARREELTAAFTAESSLTDIIRVLVDPLVELLDEPSGRRYLIIQASLLSHPDRSTWPAILARPWERPGLGALADRAAELRDGPPIDSDSVDLTRELASLLLFHALANEARTDSSPEDRARFAEALVVALVALVEADL